MEPQNPIELAEESAPIYNHAVALLARREHARKELRVKLLKKFPSSSSQIDRVLDKLAEQSYLSDARFAEAYLRHRSARGFGRERIARELAERGVSEELVRETLREAQVDEIDGQQAIELAWQKKFRHPPQDYAERAKQMRFLLYRGFAQPQIQQLFQRLESQRE